MSTTVKNNFLALALRIDPNDSNGNVFTVSTIGVNDGEKFVKQSLLDIYNEARFSLFRSMELVFSKLQISQLVPGIALIKEDLEFALGVASKPTGFVRPISLNDAAGVVINILPPSMESVVRQGVVPVYKESDDNRFVFEEGTQLRSASGSTYIPDAKTYVLKYLGIAKYTLSDVTGTTVEAFPDDWFLAIMEVAEAIANGLGIADVGAVADAFVKQRNLETAQAQ